MWERLHFFFLSPKPDSARFISKQCVSCYLSAASDPDNSIQQPDEKKLIKNSGSCKTSVVTMDVTLDKLTLHVNDSETQADTVKT